MPIPSLYSYSCDPNASLGRDYPQEEDAWRTVWQRDHDRIIHSSAFRRLEQKTQVFLEYQGKFCRTRLTHSLEVSQMSRSIARALHVNEDLTETIALAHDLGHSPFGHAGEEALNTMMKEDGGFNHNEQTFRIITYLEKSYAAFDGLNLSWETLEGIAKHHGPFTDILPPLSILDYSRQKRDLKLDLWPSVEAQIAAACDDLAYHNHDIDDGLRAELFTLDNLCSITLVRDIVADIRVQHPQLNNDRMRHEMVRRLIHTMICDIIHHSRTKIQRIKPQSVDDIRHCGESVITFSSAMAEHNHLLQEFLMTNMYHSPKIDPSTKKAQDIIKRLFIAYRGKPTLLPEAWRKEHPIIKPRVIADYIAGMTDAFARESLEKINE